jgi:type IV secretion system protein VirB6
MDKTQPITWLIEKINTVFLSQAVNVSSAISTSIMPLLTACFGIYMMLIVFNYMRGAEDNFVGDFMYRVLGFAVVMGIGFSAGSYASIVLPIVTGLGNDLASAVSGGTVTSGALDKLVIFYWDMIGVGMQDVSAYGLTGIASAVMVLVQIAIVLIGLIPFLVIATVTIITANIGSGLVAMVGPIFFGCLLFPATRQYFSAWVNTAFSYALVPLLVAVLSMVSVGISIEFMGDAPLNDGSSFNVFFAAVGNLILAALMKNVGSLASSLSAGGINMGSAGGLGSATSSVMSTMRGTNRNIKAAKELAGHMRGSGGGKKGGSILPG